MSLPGRIGCSMGFIKYNMLQRLCCVTSDPQVHGYHPSPEASYVSEGHHRSHHLYLDPGRGSGAPSLLLLHHPSYAPQDPLLRGLAPHVRRLIHVRVFCWWVAVLSLFVRRFDTSFVPLSYAGITS